MTTKAYIDPQGTLVLMFGEQSETDAIVDRIDTDRHLSFPDLASCDDSDPLCPHCAGRCTRSASVVLQRIDMEDAEGTLFCEVCSSDAMESGVFRVKEDEFVWDGE